MTYPKPGDASKLWLTLRDALQHASDGSFNRINVDHLCRDVRQILADELTRNKPRRLGPAPSDQRGKDQAIGFDLGWDAARSEVLMPTKALGRD